MPTIWQSYVPYHVAQDLALHPHANPVGREQRFDAVALFTDISGFTVISEALGEMGKKGAEKLTDILNAYFEPMIDLIHSYTEWPAWDSAISPKSPKPQQVADSVSRKWHP